MNKKTTLIGGLLIIAILAIISFNYYSKIYGTNVKNDALIQIPTGTSIEELKTILTPYLEDVESFEWVANKKKYATNIKSGQYSIKAAANNNELVNLLRSGKQTPVKLSFNNQHQLENLAGRIAIQIEADSISLLKAFKDPEFLKQNDFNTKTALAMYIPNSYQVYWNTSA
ncbi:endolytic transglycosylase MltG, partial [Flavicella sp.]|uniref:endolytic transglycosylase MltG n=1 Tax=Flavicella sp. TaxID=2957742 RepID=UPI002615A559